MIASSDLGELIGMADRILVMKGYPQALCDYVGFQLSFKRDREPFDKIQSKFSETFAPERHNCSAESLNKFHEESDELCKAKFNANPGMNTDQFLDIMGSLRRCNDLNRELFQTIVFAFKNGYESCKN